MAEFRNLVTITLGRIDYSHKADDYCGLLNLVKMVGSGCIVGPLNCQFAMMIMLMAMLVSAILVMVL